MQVFFILLSAEASLLYIAHRPLRQLHLQFQTSEVLDSAGPKVPYMSSFLPILGYGLDSSDILIQGWRCTLPICIYLQYTLSTPTILHTPQNAICVTATVSCGQIGFAYPSRASFHRNPKADTIEFFPFRRFSQPTDGCRLRVGKGHGRCTRQHLALYSGRNLMQ